MVVDRHSKTIFTQPIKTFKIITSINIFKLNGNYECFNWLCVKIYFGLLTHHR